MTRELRPVEEILAETVSVIRMESPAIRHNGNVYCAKVRYFDTEEQLKEALESFGPVGFYKGEIFEEDDEKMYKIRMVDLDGEPMTRMTPQEYFEIFKLYGYVMDPPHKLETIEGIVESMQAIEDDLGFVMHLTKSNHHSGMGFSVNRVVADKEYLYV